MFFQTDEQKNARMAALTRYLQEACNFQSLGKHVTTFTKAMFTANFRSIFCYRPEEALNRVTEESAAGKAKVCTEVYEVMNVLPSYLKAWIFEELARHRPLFKIRAVDDDYPTLDVSEWLRKFKIMFTQSRLQLRKKSQLVS